MNAVRIIISIDSSPMPKLFPNYVRSMSLSARARLGSRAHANSPADAAAIVAEKVKRKIRARLLACSFSRAAFTEPPDRAY